jgi:hypothetical protein
MPFVGFTDVNAHQSAFAFEFFMCHGGLLEAVGQADAGDREKQAENNACRDVGGGAEPLAGFKHFGGFPTETGEGSVAAKKTDGDGHAPFCGDDYTIQGELADQSEEETAGKVDKQRAVGEGAARFDLDCAAEAVARQGSDGAEQSDQEETQSVPIPAGAVYKKLLVPRGSQESSAPVVTGAVMANSIAIWICCKA